MARHPVAYLRRSHAGPTNGGRVSFDVQRAAVLEMAARRGDPEPELVVEWGLSGAAKAGTFGGTGRGGKRRAYHDLKERIEAGDVSALYAYSLSRLARSTGELLELAQLCTAHDVPIRLAKEGDIDGTTPSGRLYLTVLAAVATFEAEVAAERARDRNESMRERGAYLGRQPFGYLFAPDGTLAPDPATAPIVAQVVALFRELKSPAKVATALNRQHVAAPMGGEWKDGTIRRIVAREAGYQPSGVRGSRSVPVARFARLLRCPHHGDKVELLTPARKHYRTADGKQHLWTGYTCGAARYNRAHPAGRTVPESAVVEWAKTEIIHFAPPDVVELRRTDEAKRADLEARRGRMIDALEAGTITRSEADPRLARIAAELAALETHPEPVEVPTIDWTWEPERLNPVLRALWSRIELDPVTMQPVSGERIVPEWWSA